MNDIYKVLENLKILYKEHEHPPFFTCEEADLFYADLEAGKTKNLFLRNGKGNKHFLVLLESQKSLDIRQFGESISEKGLGFASEERLERYLGLKKGSVSPFGLIHDTNHEVTVYVDNDIISHDFLLFHPNRNTATLEISREDFQKFLFASGNIVIFSDF